MSNNNQSPYGPPTSMQEPPPLPPAPRTLEHGYAAREAPAGVNEPPGYGPPPPGSARQAAQTMQKGFSAGIFDFSFTTFVTTRIIKVLYGFYVVAVALIFLGGMGAGLMIVVAEPPPTHRRRWGSGSFRSSSRRSSPLSH